MGAGVGAGADVVSESRGAGAGPPPMEVKIVFAAGPSTAMFWMILGAAEEDGVVAEAEGNTIGKLNSANCFKSMPFACRSLEIGAKIFFLISSVIKMALFLSNLSTADNSPEKFFGSRSLI